MDRLPFQTADKSLFGNAEPILFLERILGGPRLCIFFTFTHAFAQKNPLPLD